MNGIFVLAQNEVAKNLAFLSKVLTSNFAKIAKWWRFYLTLQEKYFCQFQNIYYIALVLISSRSLAVNSSTDISPSSPTLLERTVRVPASASLSPITPM